MKPDPLNDNTNAFNDVQDPKQLKPLNTIFEKDKTVYKNALKCVFLPLLCNVDNHPKTSPFPLISNDCIDWKKSDSTMVALQKAFQVSLSLENSIRQELSNSFKDFSSSQIRVKDIYNQIQVLKSNANMFYNYDDPYYEDWKQSELKHLDELLSKLPVFNFVPSPEKSLNTTDYHEQFEILIKKVLKYDFHSIERNSKKYKSTSFVSTSTSLKVLKEFGVRFGVGEVFRKISTLSTMVMHCFEYTDCYLNCLKYCLIDTMKFLENRDRCWFLKENKMMEHTFETLHQKLEYCFEKIFDLYNQQNLSKKGVSILVELLEHTINAKSYISNQEQKCDVGSLLAKYLKIAAEKYYNTVKMQFEVSLNSQVLFHLLKEAKLCFKDFQEIFATEYLDKFTNLHPVIANTLYNCLMRDAQPFFQDIPFTKLVDQDILRLIYCFIKLDEEWICYINRNTQAWQNSFEELLSDILKNISSEIQLLIMLFLKKDNFCILQFTEIKRSDEEASEPEAIVKPFDHNFLPSAEKVIVAQEPKNILRKKTTENDSCNMSTESNIENYDDAIYSSLDNLDSKLDQFEENSISSLYASKGPCTEEEQSGSLDSKILINFYENQLIHSDINKALVTSKQVDYFITSEQQSPLVTSTQEDAMVAFKNKNKIVKKNNLRIYEKDLFMVTSSLSDLLYVCFELTVFVKTFFSVHSPSHLFFQRNDTVLKQNFLNLGSLLKIYSSSLLLFDICGIQSLMEENQRILMNHIETKFWTDLVELKKYVGCRHCIGIKDQFLNCHGIFDSCIVLQNFLEESESRIEPVTKQMCYRINNIYSLLCVLPIIQNEFANSFNISSNVMQAKEYNEYFMKYCFEAPCKTPIDYSVIMCPELMDCRKHLKRVLKVQIMLLVSRVEEIFLCLFNESLNCSKKSINEKTFLHFLSDQLNLLKHSMYAVCFQKFVQEFFNRIYELFHKTLNKILLATTEITKEKIISLENMLNEIQKILKFDSEICNWDQEMWDRKVWDQELILMFRLKLLSKSKNELYNMFHTLRHPTGNLLAVLMNSLITFEEVILNLRYLLPETFYGHELIDKLHSNMEWYNVIIDCLKRKKSVDKNNVNCMGQFLLMDQIIVTVQSEPFRMAPVKTKLKSNDYELSCSRFGSSETFLSAEFPNVNCPPRFTNASVYKFISANDESFSEIYFNGILYRIARKQKFRIDVFSDDIIKLFINHYNYKKDIDLKIFFDDYFIPIPNPIPKDCECFHFLRKS
ncbi:uncharacterized protein LOC105844565 isoform X4 [Hydra vulgaris]